MEEIIVHARAKGLDGVCITDHDTMAINEILQEGTQCNGVCVIFGVEYSTCQGDFLLFGPFESIQPGLSALELLQYVDDNEGIAVAAHPFKKGKEVKEELLIHQLCRYVEEITDRHVSIKNNPASNWGSLYAVSSVGGSDACSLAELGRVITVFKNGIKNRTDLIQALRDGAYSVEHNKYYYGTA
jgi:hypothetical protein